MLLPGVCIPPREEKSLDHQKTQTKRPDLTIPTQTMTLESAHFESWRLPDRFTDTCCEKSPEARGREDTPTPPKINILNSKMEVDRR